MGEMIMGIRKELAMKEEKIIVSKKGMIVERVRVEWEIWRIVGVYVNGDIEGKLEKMMSWTEEREKEVKIH